MKIIIAGAGGLGFHLAQLLVVENQAIILIDTNQEVLDYAASHLDVMTVSGDASSIDVLEEAGVEDANLVLAVTTFETTNLMTAILAKKKGARRTIARVNNSEYLRESQLHIFKDLGIDSLFSPRLLAAKEICRLINRVSFTDIFEFEDGKISLVGITLDDDSPLVNTRMDELKKIESNVALRPMAILRGHQTIIPRGDVMLRKNDHVYFITSTSKIDMIEKFVGSTKKKVKNIMILAGSGLAFETAKLLEDEYNVTLIEGIKDRCKIFAEKLNKSLIINGRADNTDLLQEEGLDNMDALIALTPNSESNIIACLTAKNHGVYRTIAQVENKEYTHISQNIGVDTLINVKLIAANNIFRHVRKGRIEAITGLHGVDAEVIEFVVTKNNHLTRKPLRDLYFPKSALIGCVIRGEETLLPNGDFTFQLDDKAIVFTMPEAIAGVEKLFR